MRRFSHEQFKLGLPSGSFPDRAKQVILSGTPGSHLPRRLTPCLLRSLEQNVELYVCVRINHFEISFKIKRSAIILAIPRTVRQCHNDGCRSSVALSKCSVDDRFATLRQKIQWKREFLGFWRDVTGFPLHVICINQLDSNVGVARRVIDAASHNDFIDRTSRLCKCASRQTEDHHQTEAFRRRQEHRRSSGLLAGIMAQT